MAEQNKIGHLFKGIADDVYKIIVQGNIGTAEEFVKERSRFQELKRSSVEHLSFLG